MNCGRCGDPLIAGAVYCTKCGAPISGLPVRGEKKSGCLIAGLIAAGVIVLGVIGVGLVILLSSLEIKIPLTVSLSDSQSLSQDQGTINTQQNEGTINGHNVKILEVIDGKSFGDTELTVISYEWTNNSGAVTTFSAEFATTVYQNGVELSEFFIAGSEPDVDYSASVNKVQPGATQTVYCAYQAGDTSDITVEVASPSGKEKVVKTLTLE